METSEHDDSGGYMQRTTESNRTAQGTLRNQDDELPAQHLKLDICDSFLSSVRLMLPWFRTDPNGIKHSDRSRCEELNAAQNQLASVKNSKEVPTELPLLGLSFGNKQLFRTTELNIFARFYYLAKKIVCQTRVGTCSTRVDVPFSDITALHVCFDNREFDSLSIEAKVPFKYFYAVNTRPAKFPDWKVADPDDVDLFPESEFIFLAIEKGVLEKGIAKLLYTDPRLECFLHFSGVTSSYQPMQYNGHMNAQTQ